MNNSSAHKFVNVDEMDQLFERQNMTKLTQKETI